MNNKLIIIATTFFLLISFMFLAWTEKKQSDINLTNTWAISFDDAKNSSLDFTIANYSDNKNFKWEVFADKTKIKENTVAIKKGESLKIPVSISDTVGKKIAIIVTDEKNQKKEIYKIF